MQRWEYLEVLKSRGWKDERNGEGWYMEGKWVNRIISDGGEKLSEGESMHAILKMLGQEGWELVAITPRSSRLGGSDERHSDKGVAISADYAGFTSEEVWVFKRPKGGRD